MRLGGEGIRNLFRIRVVVERMLPKTIDYHSIMKAVIKVADAVIVYAVTASVLVWAVSVFVLTFWNVEHLPRLGPFFITYTPPLLIIIDVAELILRRSLEAFVVAAAVRCLVEMLVV